MSIPKVIALYLPQYHPTPDNDLWWGKGFTEWTNVAKAKPLFRGHYQPHIPADLGFYDLRLPQVREAQAKLARESGIYGFCYYHYWFGNGKQELELPFKEVLASGKPDFPFMLCWANETWHKKFWNKDGKGSSKEILVKQEYPGKQDMIDHFYHLLPAFKDNRYIKYDGKPLFMIYRPLDYDQISDFIHLWNSLALQNGLKGIYFIGTHYRDNRKKGSEEFIRSEYISLGFDGVNFIRVGYPHENQAFLSHAFKRLRSMFFNIPYIYNYNKIYHLFCQEIDSLNGVFPTIIPNWDHTPRSGTRGVVFTNTNPLNFSKHIEQVLEQTKLKNSDLNYIFLKSWNEWGEGNYVEPDLRFGHAFLNIYVSISG